MSGKNIDADQRLTHDVDKLTNDLAGLVTGMVKPSVDILWLVSFPSFYTHCLATFWYLVSPLNVHISLLFWSNSAGLHGE